MNSPEYVIDRLASPIGHDGSPTSNTGWSWAKVLWNSQGVQQFSHLVLKAEGDRGEEWEELGQLTEDVLHCKRHVGLSQP